VNVVEALLRAVTAGAVGIWILERIAAIRRAQQRAAFRQDAANLLEAKGNDGAREKAFEAELDADDFDVVIADERAHRRPDHGIEPRTIAAAGEDTDAFHGRED
jgi:hypothetical protein